MLILNIEFYVAGMKLKSMSASPLISIVVVTLNAEKTIMDTIASLESQCFKDFEVIFKDGGSTDSTIEKIKLSKLNYIISTEPDNGIYDAMNKGAIAASGDFLTFLNADDQLFSNATLKNISIHLITDNADLYYGPINIISERNKENVQREWKASIFNKLNFSFGFIPPHPGSVINRKVFFLLNSFDDSYKLAGDFDFFLKCLKMKIKNNSFNFVTVLMADGGASSGLGRTLVIKCKEITRSFYNNGFIFLGLMHLTFRAFYRLVNILANMVRGN